MIIFLEMNFFLGFILLMWDWRSVFTLLLRRTAGDGDGSAAAEAEAEAAVKRKKQAHVAPFDCAVRIVWATHVTHVTVVQLSVFMRLCLWRTIKCQ